MEQLRVVYNCGLWLLFAVVLGCTSGIVSAGNEVPDAVSQVCKKIGAKLSSVTERECLAVGFTQPKYFSVKGSALLEKHFPANNRYAPRILFLGGIHGDEYSSVSVTFKWLKTLSHHHSGAYDWCFLPLVNPDGLLQKRSTRVNANKVDLNRNFVPAAGFPAPMTHWQTRAKKRPRYYPGTAPLSEPESRAVHETIARYRPDVIISVHAPHGILDFDGKKQQPPRKLGPLYLRQLGTYPGSLGNYAWFVEQIPVMTIELPHAGIMPSQVDISRMWVDLVRWLKHKAEKAPAQLAKKGERRAITPPAEALNRD